MIITPIFVQTISSTDSWTCGYHCSSKQGGCNPQFITPSDHMQSQTRKNFSHHMFHYSQYRALDTAHLGKVHCGWQARYTALVAMRQMTSTALCHIRVLMPELTILHLWLTQIKIPFNCSIPVSFCDSDTMDLGSKPMNVLEQLNSEHALQ